MAELCYNKLRSAGVAHPVERHLAKVEVASSSLVTRSIKVATAVAAFLFVSKNTPCVGIILHRGLFTYCPVLLVRFTLLFIRKSGRIWHTLLV